MAQKSSTAVCITIVDWIASLQSIAPLDATRHEDTLSLGDIQLPTVIVFRNEVDAMRFAVDGISGNEENAIAQRLRVLVWHFAGGLGKERVSRPDLEALASLLKRARPGEIRMARTVYDSVRGKISLPYDAEPDVGTLSLTNAMMLQNRKRFDLMADSSVCVSRGKLLALRRRS